MSKSEKDKAYDFDEEWTRINDGVLRIKWYYFPTATDLCINIGDIKSVKTISQADDYVKNWGSNGFTWWACDMKRNFRDHPQGFYNVKIDVGSTFKKGFTVHDINGFLQALRKYMHPETPVNK